MASDEDGSKASRDAEIRPESWKLAARDIVLS